MNYVILKPILGTKNDCAIDSITLTQPLDREGKVWACHDTGGQNFDLERQKDSCSKSYGRAQWSNTAASCATVTGSICLGLHELWDGTNRERFFFDSGQVYRYDASRDPVLITDTASTTFANDAIDLYSIIQYGSHMVFADHGEHTPYKCDHDDTALTMLIDAGTEFKFRYLLNFTNRIVGLYTGQSNGDIDIRYTDVLAGTEFPAANQLYKEGASITGGHILGHNTAFIFGETDIYRMDYYGAQIPVFSVVEVLKGWGSVNHHCIVSDGIFLYFFDQHRGFCKFDGMREPLVISEDYEGMISRIPVEYSNLITGTWIPFTNEIAWSIPGDDEIKPSRIIFYNRKTGQWRHENKVARCLSTWRYYAGMTWNDLIVMTDDAWTASKWVDYTAESSKLVMDGNNGQLYASTSEGDDAGDWPAYRIEPILPLPDKTKMKRLLEVWFGIAQTQAANVDIYWRGGDTPGEVEGVAWTSIGSISMNDPDNAVIYPDRTARLHQIKWGTDLKNEPFGINEIRIGYRMQGNY